MANHPNRAPRSGHLPGHTRKTFEQALDAFLATETDQPLPLVSHEIQYRERLISVAEACKLVWYCTDVLPGLAFRELRDRLSVPPVIQTYAAAAQAILEDLKIAGMVDTEADIARRRLYDARDAAWRTLEDWIFVEQTEHGDDKASSFDWAIARTRAKKAVEQWREQPLEVIHPNIAKLVELMEAVIAAENLIEARRQVTAKEDMMELRS